MRITAIHTLSTLVSVLALAACAPQQSSVQMGAGNPLVSGSAGGSTSVDANKSLIRCASPLGTLAVDEDRKSVV